MDISPIAEVFQLGTPVGIIVFSCWFLVVKLWPLFETERAFSREHRVTRHTNEHNSDMATAEALTQIASATALLAKSVQDCPLKADF